MILGFRKKGTKDLRMIKNNNFLATFIGRSLPVDMTKEYFEKIIGEEKKKKKAQQCQNFSI